MAVSDVAISPAATDLPVPPAADRPAQRLIHRITRPATWPAWASVVAIIGVTAVALWQLHPSLLLASTTTAGGDTGAHVALAKYLESNLLVHGQLTGWDPGWYDGFPLYTFYFPLPGLITVAFNAVASYDVAFKLVTVLGTLTLPVAAWAFGKLAGLRDPGPGCLAAATLPFLFEPSFSIYGGNILSTLAGEFSFSLALSLALVFLGLVAAGLRTGRHRSLAAILLAATVLCHVIPAIFAVIGAGVWLILDADLRRSFQGGLRGMVARRRWSRRLLWLVVVGVIGLGLAAWWLVPFAFQGAYSTNMGWLNIDGFPHLLFPASSRWIQAAALVGLVATLIRRNRVGMFLAIMGAISAGVVCLDPQGKLYNVRFLPFWFLCLYLLGGIAVAETVSAAARWMRRRRLEQWVRRVRRRSVIANGAGPILGGRGRRLQRPNPGTLPAGAVAGPVIALAAVFLAVLPPLVLPASALTHVGVTVGANQPSAWADWNYSGYERKPDYPEYKAVINMMASVGAQQGCGRTMWEYDPSLNRFGTTESLMLLPYWTNNCIDSMEGLLFESSTTTPYHFINQSELSVTPSDAMVGLPYGGLNVPLGIEHLQQLGVRYFLASSATTERAAAADPSLTEVASSGPWHTIYNGQVLDTTWKVYRIAGSQLVQPLTNQPVVWQGVGAAQTSWLNPSVAWYDNPSAWDVVPAAGGPANWERVAVGDTTPAKVAEPPTKVTNITQSNSSISFHVDKIGTPVEVKISYFPNWKATGANGPWRVAPNLMVVVPTSHDVTLHYGTTGVDDAAWLITAAAGVAALALAVVGWRVRRRNGRRRVRRGGLVS
ncbi:MAG TPA: hypothetical protein VHU85_03105 [Acidimicrobiales bacterium]|nr:hypothetical protein [Acidimicrobiales bacterium]